jgi:cell division septation protein DedD
MSYNLGRIDPDERPGLYAVPPDDEPLARPRRVLAIGAALLVMGLFAGGLWLAYVAGLRHAGASGSSGDIPLIRADTRPMKVKPPNPGGMVIPDRNMLIYGEGQPTVEHLLPPPEQPMARPSPPVPSSQPAPIVAAAAGAAVAPTPVHDRPDQTAATPADTAPANPRQAAPAPTVAETASAGTAPVRLQLGSVRSEAAAREEWDRLRRDNPDLLGNLSAVAVRADLGDRGVYFRIETDPVANAARADRICGELRQRHFGCMIIR